MIIQISIVVMKRIALDMIKPYRVLYKNYDVINTSSAMWFPSYISILVKIRKWIHANCNRIIHHLCKSCIWYLTLHQILHSQMESMELRSCNLCIQIEGNLELITCTGYICMEHAIQI